jgi:glutamate synthase (NADH)
MGRVSFAEDVEQREIVSEEEQTLSVFDYQDTPENKSWAGTLPLKQGLYDPDLEKDACGVGFAAYVSDVFDAC